MTASLLQLLHVCKELNVCVQYEQPVGMLPVSVVLQGRNCGMCLRSSTEVSLITFIVPLILIHQAHKVDCCSSYVCSLNRFIWLQDFPSHKRYFIILCFLPYARHKWLGVADSGQLPPNSFEHTGHECRVIAEQSTVTTEQGVVLFLHFQSLSKNLNIVQRKIILKKHNTVAHGSRWLWASHRGIKIGWKRVCG